MKEAAKESQKEAARRQKAKDQSKLNQNIVRCSNCHSTNVEFVGNKKKNFSVGKAVAGSILVPGAGALVGFAGKKGKKNNWHCKDCGNFFVK